MIGLIIFFLIILSPYFIFQRKRFQESRDKERFLKTHFYHSNLWIIVLIFISIMVVNLFAPDIPIEDKEELSDSQQYDSLEEVKSQQAGNIDFHYAYLNSYVIEKSIGTRPFVIVDNYIMDYYDSVEYAGLKGIANWGKGYYYLKWKKQDSTLAYFDEIPNSFKYKNLALAELFTANNEDSIAALYLKKEVQNENGAKELATTRLIDYYQAKDNIDALREVLELPGAKEYFPFRLHRKLYFLSVDLINYYKVVILHFWNRMNHVGILAAFIVAMVWLYYIIKLAFFQQVKTWEILLSLSMGILFTFLTFLLSDSLYYNSHYGMWNMFTWSVIGIGAIEELVKIIPLLIIIFVIKRRLEAFEYILFASVSAIGFAFTENLLYFDGSYGLIISGRAVTAAVGHMIDSSVFAYGLVLTKFRYNKNVIPFFFLFWALASIIHGLYDYFLFVKLYFFFLMFFLLCARIWVTIINNSINQSEGFSYNSNFNTRKLQFAVTFLLTAVFMFEYMVAGFTFGQDVAMVGLFSAFFSGGFLIAFLGSKLTSLNLVKGYWEVANFSVNPFTDDIVSQNFVGGKILIKPYHADRGLIEYASEVKGKIVRRVVLQNRERQFLRANDDSKWFLVKLEEQIHEEGMRSEYVLIKLKDNYSSLNDQKKFMVHLLLIPKSISFKADYPMRKDFKSLGWAWISAY
ncbi:PrsW family glutamic-type intramembrane protease [Ekhidna sp.]|uniref:PrsW family intramembrane metalloprotease n=1 Tax=Ekhidna sp. TaxID=2608089 RepID=UPI003297BA1D